MADFGAIGSAFYSLLVAATALPVHQQLAPQGTKPPYVIFQRQAAVDEYTFTDKAVSADYLVRVVSNRTWPSEAQQAYDTLHMGIQDGVLSATGYNVLRMRRRSTVEYRDADGYWHVGGLYRIDVEKV